MNKDWRSIESWREWRATYPVRVGDLTMNAFGAIDISCKSNDHLSLVPGGDWFIFSFAAWKYFP